MFLNNKDKHHSDECAEDIRQEVQPVAGTGEGAIMLKKLHQPAVERDERAYIDVGNYFRFRIYDF